MDVIRMRADERAVILSELRTEFPSGTRIVLEKFTEKHDKLVVGSKGTVMHVDDAGTIHINWDCGSTLGVIYSVDKVRKLTEGAKEIYDYRVGDNVMIKRGPNAGKVAKITRDNPEEHYPIHLEFSNGDADCTSDINLMLVPLSIDSSSKALANFSKEVEFCKSIAMKANASIKVIWNSQIHLCYVLKLSKDCETVASMDFPIALLDKRDVKKIALQHEIAFEEI